MGDPGRFLEKMNIHDKSTCHKEFFLLFAFFKKMYGLRAIGYTNTLNYSINSPFLGRV